jgi:hypothetical protein
MKSQANAQPGRFSGESWLASVLRLQTGGASAGDVAADVTELSAACIVVLVAASGFTNFLEGAFEGRSASDYILARVFLATS